jgi:hypothetical protein
VVEVFLAAGLTAAERSALLAEAVRARREGLVELLMEHGADVRAVPFEDALYEWHPGVVRLFCDG